MSLYKVAVVARNPKHEELATPSTEAVVDTGSELTWLPYELLAGAGISPRRKKVFVTADGTRIEREVGYAIIEAEGFSTIRTPDPQESGLIPNRRQGASLCREKLFLCY